MSICRHYSIPEEQFHKLYEPAKSHILEHLAGGIDRQGRDFFTIYYGEWPEEIMSWPVAEPLKTGA